MSIVMPSSHAELLTPRQMLSGSLSGIPDMERQPSLTTPRSGGELRSFGSFGRTQSGHCSTVAPLPSPRQYCTTRSSQVVEANGSSSASTQSQTQGYESHRSGACNRSAFKANESLPSCPFKAVPTRLPLMRSWAVHSAYRSEFALEIEAQQTPRYGTSKPHTAQGFGISSAPHPIRTKPSTPGNGVFQAAPMMSVRESCCPSSSLSGSMSDEVMSSPHTPCSRMPIWDIPKHLLVPPTAPVKKRKCEADRVTSP